jgi:hypothetical protein
MEKFSPFIVCDRKDVYEEEIGRGSFGIEDRWKKEFNGFSPFDFIFKFSKCCLNSSCSLFKCFRKYSRIK